MVVQKTLYLTEYHLFFVNCVSFSPFFDAENFLRKFIVPAVTFRKILGRGVVSFYRVASLTAYKYLRRIIVLFVVSHCIKIYNICNIYNINII